MSFYKDLNKIVKSDITKTKSEQLKSPLEVQMKVNSAYVEWLEDTQMDIEAPTEVIKGATHIEYHAPVAYINVSNEASATFGTFEQGTTRTYDNVGTVLENVSGNSQVTTGSAMFASPSLQDFSGLRERYRKECAKHEVNCVEDGCIKPLNVDVQDFAVNLRIRKEKRNPATNKTYRGEMARHLESLKDHGETIEVEELLNMVEADNKIRVFFVGGVAGIGKSVLAKRIAYDWSCSEVYRHIKCLLYITCRKLNNFLHKSDKEIEVEVIEKYLKETWKDVSIEDDKATLFLIDGFDELQKPGMIQAFTDKFSKSKFLIFGRPHSQYFVDGTNESFLRFSFMERGSFDEDDEVSYKLLEELSDGDKLRTSPAGRLITRKDAQNVILDILNKVGEIEDGKDRFLLKLRFISDCLEATDKVGDTSFLRNLLHTLTPSSSVYVNPTIFEQQNLSTILRLASKNGLIEAEIENIFNGVEFRIHDLKQMDIISYSQCLSIDWVVLNNIVEFTQSQSVLIHQNIAYCGGVTFVNCSVPSLPCSTSLASPPPTTTTTTTSYDRKERKEMKLEKLRMLFMNINQSDVSSAANLIGLAEEVELDDVRVGGKEFEKIMEKVIEINPRRLKGMELWRCPLVNHDLKQKMRENGVTISELDKRTNSEMTIELNRMVSSILDRKSILISNAPGNQVEAIEIKQKFADEIGCPVFVNIKLLKYYPQVVVVLLTDGYEKSEQCKEMMIYAKSMYYPKIIAVKLDNDFQPGDELNYIVSWKRCIYWTDETNFDTNFTKVKEEINARFAKERLRL
eukprot:gene19451-biopygen14431